MKFMFKVSLLMCIASASALVLAACGNGGSSQEADALRAELTALRAQVNNLGDAVDDLAQALEHTHEEGDDVMKEADDAMKVDDDAVTPSGDGEVVHGTFDFNDQIGSNIRSGVTQFGIDQQPFLQGYEAVTILYLNRLFRTLPPNKVTPTGPGFITTSNIDAVPGSPEGYRSRADAPVNVHVVHHGESSNVWWDTMNMTMELAARNMGANLAINVPTSFDLNQVRDLIDQARAAQPDGMAITMTDPVLFKPSVDRVLDDGIPVVGFNAGTGPDDDNIAYGTYIGQREYDGGLEGGRFLAREAGSGSHKGICINQEVGHIGLDDRCRGFADALNEAGIRAQVLAVTNDRASSQQTISDFYAGNPDVDIFFTLGPSSADPFYDFVQSEGLDQNTFLHGTFDFSDAIGQNIRSGVTLFGINQQQPLQAYNSIKTLVHEHRYGITPASKVTNTGPAFIVLDNIDSAPTRFVNEGLMDNPGQLNFIAVQHARCAWDSFWCTVEEGIRRAEEETGVNVTILGPESFDLNRVAELIDQARAANPDGVLLTYTNNELFKGPVQRLLDSGIPVVAYNAGNPEVDEVDYLTYVGQDEYLGGLEGGRRLATAAGSGIHKGICLNHQVGHTGLDARCRGFSDAMDEAGIPLAGNGVLSISDDAAQSQQAISDFYASNPDVDIFLTLGPGGATPFYGFLADEGLIR